MVAKIIDFFSHVIKECRRITWATKKEVTTSVLLVVFVVLIASVLLFVTDMFVFKIVQFLLEFGR